MASLRPRSLSGNVPRYYLYTVLANTGLWAGVWIKYLTVSRGFELKWVFLMDLPFWLAVSILQVPLGTLADRVGRRKMMAAGQFAYALTILGFGLVDSYLMLFLDYLLWAAAQSMSQGADQALLYDSLKAEKREADFPRTVGRGFTVLTTAGFFSVLAGGFVGDLTSLSFVILLSSVFPALAACVALTMREAPHEPSGRRYLAELRDGFGFAWRYPQVRYTVALGSVIMAAAFAPQILMQPFLIHHEVSTRFFGVFQAPLRLATVAAALTAHRIVGRFGAPSVFTTSCTAIIVGFALLGSIDRVPAFAFFAVPALVQGVTKPTFDAYLNARIPSARRATVLSVWSLALALQLAFLEPALGFVTDYTHPAGAALATALWFGLLLPPLYVVWLRAHRRPLASDHAAGLGGSV